LGRSTFGAGTGIGSARCLSALLSDAVELAAVAGVAGAAAAVASVAGAAAAVAGAAVASAAPAGAPGGGEPAGMGIIGALRCGRRRAGSFDRASFPFDCPSEACFALESVDADDAAVDAAENPDDCAGAEVATDARDAAGDSGDKLGAAVISRSTDRSSFGIRETITTDSEATVANARPGPNQLDFSHDFQPDATGFVAGRATATRPSARMRVSHSADGCSASAMCAWYNALRRASDGSDEWS
jgi:hypothetical protein